MKHNNFFATALVGLLILVLTGCGNPDNRYSRIEGTITYNGAAVEGATVSFQAVDPAGESASGLTDANGRFTLTSVQAKDGGRGALPGDYLVTVSKREMPPPDPDQAAFDAGEITYDELQSRLAAKGAGSTVRDGPPSRDLLPAKYRSAATSGLKATVVSGRNAPVDFDLTDD